MSKKEKIEFVGYVLDRLRSMYPKKTKKYKTYYEAHSAAEKLCKRTMGDRGSIHVRTIINGEISENKY